MYVQLRKCNGKGGFVQRVRIASQTSRSLRVALRCSVIVIIRYEIDLARAVSRICEETPRRVVDIL